VNLDLSVNYMSNRSEKRKDQTFQNLLDVGGILGENDIFWWIQNGLLLGLYRGGDMISGDENDVDVGIHFEDTDKFVALRPEFEKLGFRFRATRTPYKTVTVALKRNATKMHVHVNCVQDDIVYQPMDKSGRIFVFPKEVYDAFDVVEWRDVNFNRPKKIEQYLICRYGKDWNIPLTKGHGWTAYNDPVLNPCYYDNLEQYEKRLT